MIRANRFMRIALRIARATKLPKNIFCEHLFVLRSFHRREEEGNGPKGSERFSEILRGFSEINANDFAKEIAEISSSLRKFLANGSLRRNLVCDSECDGLVHSAQKIEVGGTAFFITYYMFYFGSAIVGYVMGHTRTEQARA